VLFGRAVVAWLVSCAAAACRSAGVLYDGAAFDRAMHGDDVAEGVLVGVAAVWEGGWRRVPSSLGGVAARRVEAGLLSRRRRVGRFG
jgi:hypothetical protein